MPGLLDFLGSDEAQAGLAMLAAAGPSAVPMSAGQRLSGAMGQLRQQRLEKQKLEQQMREQAQREALMALQLQQAQRQFGRQQQIDALAGQYARSPAQTALAGGGGPTEANAQAMQTAEPSFDYGGYAKALAGVDPMMALQLQQSLRKEKPQPQKLSPGETLFDMESGKAIYTNPKSPDDPAAIREYQFARQQGFGGSFLDFQQTLRKAGATALTVDMRGDNAYATAQGKEYSDLMGNINKSAFSAPAQIRKLERMTQLLDGVDGGKLSPAGLEIASALNGLGIKVDPRLGNKEAAQALSRELAGGLRQPGTGPMTDRDFENFLQQIPDLSKTAPGRKQITDTMTAALNRDMRIGQLAREYERRHGRIDGKFLDEIAAFIAENPVVSAPVGWRVQR